MFKESITVIFFALLSLHTFGQRTETALYFNQRNTHIHIESENDLLFQTDYYYTAGVALSSVHKNLKNTPAQFILKSKKQTALFFNGFGIEQRIFTPFSIKNPTTIENDRPYTAYFMLSNFSTRINLEKHLKIANEIGIGVMGPAAGGKEIQTNVHQLLGSTLPNGWENQLSNSFIIDYQFRIEKGFLNEWTANHIIPIGEVRIGTLINKVDIGLKLKFGNVTKSLKEKEAGLIKNQIIWEWLFEAKYQRVFYDATLQGGIISKDKVIALSKTEISLRQYHLRSGFNFYYKRLFFRYMIYFNSKNFSSGKTHQYGGISIGFSF